RRGGRHGLQLGQQPHQFVSPRVAGLRDDLGAGFTHGRADRVDERTVGHGRGFVVAAGPEDRNAAARACERRETADQARLAHTGLAGQEYNLPLAALHLVKMTLEPAQLVAAADHAWRQGAVTTHTKAPDPQRRKRSEMRDWRAGMPRAISVSRART